MQVGPLNNSRADMFSVISTGKTKEMSHQLFYVSIFGISSPINGSMTLNVLIRVVFD